MHIHVPLIGDETNGTVGQALGTADILHRIAERQFKNRNETGEPGRGFPLLGLACLGRGYLVEIDAAAGRRFEGLLFVLAIAGTQNSSIGSVISRTSIPRARKPSSCGLFLITSRLSP